MDILATLCAPLADGESAFARVSALTYELDANRDPTTGEGTAMLYGAMHLDAESFQAWHEAQPWLTPAFDEGERHSPARCLSSLCLPPPLTFRLTTQMCMNRDSPPRA